MIVTNVMAVSLDGRIASHSGERDEARRAAGFTNDDDRRHLIEMIRASDAVIVGRASLEASGGAFDDVNDAGVHPIWAVMTNHGLRADARLLTQTELPRWIVSRAPLASLPAQPNLRNLVTGEQSAPRVLLAALDAAGARRVLLLGGAVVNRAFYDAGLVDRLILTVCPVILGSDAAVPLVAPPLKTPKSLTLASSQSVGDLVFLTYTLHNS